MPRYDYRCAFHTFEKVVALANADRMQFCPHCGLLAHRVILEAPKGFVQGDIHYTSPIDGRVISSKAARVEDLKRNGCIPYDPEMKKDAARRRAESEQRLLDNAAETAAREVAAMPERMQKALGAELATKSHDIVRTKEGER